MTPSDQPATTRPPATARRIAAAVRSGEATAVAGVEACLERIQAVEPQVGAFLEVYGGEARERARQLDRRVAAGEDPGPLAGVPVAVKDNLALAGHRLTCASRLLEGFRSPYTATAVQRLLDAGAVVVGKTNLDEFAMGSSCEHSALATTRNPWDRQRVPGGSSGGSAAAVAAGCVPLALGSDTGGSVRQPAAFCGVVGLQGTWGRVSRHGLVAFASSFDQVGPLARTVADAALALEVMAGADPHDATCSERPVPEELGCPGALDGDPSRLRGLKVGRLREMEELVREAAEEAEVLEATLEHFEACLELLAEQGAEVVEVSVPGLRDALPVYHLLAACEASANLARFDGVRYGRRAGADGQMPASLDDLYLESRSRGFGPEVRRRILLGTFALSGGYAHAFHRRARRAREALSGRLLAAFGGSADRTADLLALPTTPGPAFPLGERCGEPLEMYGSDAFTVPASLAGLPAVAVPSGLSEAGLPLSLQLVGRPFGEVELLIAAAAFETLVGFEHRAAQLRDPSSGGASR